MLIELKFSHPNANLFVKPLAHSFNSLALEILVMLIGHFIFK